MRCIGSKTTKPFIVDIKLNGIMTAMEVNTGAQVATRQRNCLESVKCLAVHLHGRADSCRGSYRRTGATQWPSSHTPAPSNRWNRTYVAGLKLAIIMIIFTGRRYSIFSPFLMCWTHNIVMSLRKDWRQCRELQLLFTWILPPHLDFIRPNLCPTR